MRATLSRITQLEPAALFEIVFSVALLGVLAATYLGGLESWGLLIILPMAAWAGALPVIYGAVRQLIAREWASMEMLASVALGFSLYSKEWDSAVFIALMLSGSRLLSVLTEARARKSIESLLKLRPDTAKVEREGRIELVPLLDVRVGDTVIVDAGDRVPVDGSVLLGDAAIDESSLTGESVPVDKTPGAKVFSSTLVASGGLRIKAEKVGKDTTLEKIIELVETSQQQRSRIMTIGERFGRAYLIGMTLIAFGLWLITHNTPLVLALVLVVCADDIAIAVPLAFLGAIGTAAQHGIIVKGSAHLEVLGRAKTFIFDKTGTLTKGALKVVKVSPAEGVSADDLIAYGACAARGSQHPLSRALVAYADAEGVRELFPDISRSVGGKGVVATQEGVTLLLGRESFIEGEGVTIDAQMVREINDLSDAGYSVSIVARDKKLLGVFGLQDEIKMEAREALSALRALGVEHVVMLTGDNERVAHTVCGALGITEYYAGLHPEDKVARVKELKAKGEVVMAGDGINDAAALSSATVGIAMGGMGHDVTIESADVVLMTDDLSKLVEAVRIARVAQNIAVQDFWIWGVTNAVGIAFVFAGFIGPAGAAAYNFISDFFPLGNSLRAWRTQKA
jgi:heavy metal translocating P-type ATPase